MMGGRLVCFTYVLVDADCTWEYVQSGSELTVCRSVVDECSMAVFPL